MTININGINIYYEMIGNGKPLIFMHGNGESGKIFKDVAQKLAAKFTVYLLDSRGHGASDRTPELHYKDMSLDLISFISTLNIERPLFVGFSDGGIVGLLSAISCPDIFEKMIICGANTSPKGLKNNFLMLFKAMHFVTRNKGIKMMLTEPNITAEDLKVINIPTAIVAGSKDIVKFEDTEFIAKNIRSSRLDIQLDETHSSYVMDSDKLHRIIDKYFGEASGDTDCDIY